MPAKTKAQTASTEPSETQVSMSVRASALNDLGFQPTIELLCEEIRELYLADEVPWILGDSGGKDSTATLQLVWTALAGIPADQRIKIVHVISTDTLVENPVVAAWVSKSLAIMNSAASAQELPIKTHRLTPDVASTFWVNLIGRGYHKAPAPFVARHDRLAHDEALGHTHIEQGYFEAA